MKLRSRLSAQWGRSGGPNRRRSELACAGFCGAGPKRGAGFQLWAALPSLVLLHCLDILTRYGTVGPFYHLPSANQRYCLAKMSKSRSLGRNLRQLALLLLGLTLAFAGAGLLASCSTMGGEIPTAMGGLPDGAPERPQTPPPYPAVHDMPPPRNSAVLTEEEKKKVEAELAVMRAQQARRAQSSAANPN